MTDLMDKGGWADGNFLLGLEKVYQKKNRWLD